MEKDGGLGIYTHAEGQKSKNSPSVARKQSKSSFSVPSPRLKLKGAESSDHDDRLRGIDDFKLDEPDPNPKRSQIQIQKPDQEKQDDDVLPDFELVDKGVEIEEEEGEKQSEYSDNRSVSSEVVKEVVQDQSHVARMTELDTLAQQIKALESMIGDEKEPIRIEDETGSQRLDAEEDKVTREFLQMLEDAEEEKGVSVDDKIPRFVNYEKEEGEEVFLPDLGKGLGCVVQTRNGGYLAAVNPLDVVVSRKDSPKLAMQISKPVVIQSDKTGFEVFQKMAAIGLEKMTSEILSLMPMDDLTGKTAEQIAFEGIASAIIQGRNKEGANSSAARTVAGVKAMANAMNLGRRERVSSGIWNVREDPVTIEEILAFAVQKIESMAMEALKIQAEITEEEAPFDVSPLESKTTGPDRKVYGHILQSAVPIEECLGLDCVTVAVVVQLRDPIRQYEAVGGPMIALIHATGEGEADGERRYRVGSLQVGGVKGGNHGEKQKLTGLQWLVTSGLGKAGKKGKRGGSKGPDVLWSISSRIMADMWLKPIRNPDVKFNAK